MQVEIIQKQCVQAQQAMRQLKEAQAASSDLQSQLDRLQQRLHSQQHFVTCLETTIAGTNLGETFCGIRQTVVAPSSCCQRCLPAPAVLLLLCLLAVMTTCHSSMNYRCMHEVHTFCLGCAQPVNLL